MARNDRPASFVGVTGAGLYGGPAKSHVTTCVNSKNPHGHNPACPCGWARERPSQTVPYAEQPIVPGFPRSRHDDLFGSGDAA